MLELVAKYNIIRTVEETDENIIIHGHGGVCEDTDMTYPKHSYTLEKDKDFYYIYCKFRNKMHYSSQYPQELKDKYENVKQN